MTADEERIALFLDYENLAIGAREHLGGASFTFGPVADALADRGRVVVRKAYADWTMFETDSRMLTGHHVELIEIPQRMGMVRKNAADIKLAVDAVELALERGYVTTFVLGTGDSDFTPLVHKLRSLDKRVIGIGIRASTSEMLPPACDEFLFYERLEGVEASAGGSRRRRSTGSGSGGAAAVAPAPPPAPLEGAASVGRLLTRTLAGIQSSSGAAVRASSLKRALVRREPTFSEADYGFRGFGELLAHLAGQGILHLEERDDTGDPEVSFPSEGAPEDAAFELLRDVVVRSEKRGSPPTLSGLKDRMRKRDADFSEKEFGYGGFLQFVRAAQARGLVDLAWDDEAEDYRVRSLATS
jgi:uncharacterized LabA/DUF88 family protein